SQEEFIMTEYQNASPGFKQDPELLAIINTNIAHIEKMVQNLEVKITELEETTDQDLLQIINEQELVSKQKEIKNKIQTLVGELKTYRETKLTKDELNTKIAVISKKIAEYQKDVIKEVKIKSKVQTEQIVDEGLVQKAVEEYLKNKVLTQEQRGEYYTRTRNLQEQVRILQDLISYEIEYEYKESEKITLIKEILLAPQELRGILIQEFIPKDVIKISEIIFTTTPSELNTIGVLWLLRELENSEVRYTTLSEKDLNQLQMIRTILLYDIDEFLNVLSEEKLNASSQITGEAVAKQKQGFSLTKMVLVPIGIIIVIALIIYYFVFLKTQSVYEREIIENIDMQEQQSLRKLKVPVKRSDNVSEVRTIVSVSKSDLDILLGFIQKAYEGLEHSDIDNAYKNYSQALSHYSHAKLNLKHRLKVNFEMNTLYDKIVETKKPS
ncbi:hypothetical protein KY341_06260, partial [Candidatus Woesearchaeota archaeon]|nr:hypothetical protein [Candidatus Woesearchaeota archaeon]